MPNVIELEETGSTSDDAKRLAGENCPTFTVVWAHRQNAGRGNHQRQWVSIEGNVFWSIVIRPEKTWPTFSDLVFVNALAVLNTIRDATAPTAPLQLKWPNDILLAESKVAGSLIESGGRFEHGRPEWIVIGTGINVVDNPPATPSMIYPPTNLRAHGYNAERESIVRNLLTELTREIESWCTNGFMSVRERYLKQAFRLGQEITVGAISDKSKYHSGKYVGIDEWGALLLDVGSSAPERILSGEVVLRKG